MSIPPTWQECLDFVGRPIVLEPWHAQLPSDAGLLAIRRTACPGNKLITALR